MAEDHRTEVNSETLQDYCDRLAFFTQENAALRAEVERLKEIAKSHALTFPEISFMFNDLVKQHLEKERRYVEALGYYAQDDKIGAKAKEALSPAPGSQEADHCPCGPDMSSPDCQIHADHIPDVAEKVKP